MRDDELVGQILAGDTRAATEAQRTAPAPNAIVMGEEAVEWLHRSLERLPEKLRDAMTLYYIEGLSIAEATRCLESREGSGQRHRSPRGRRYRPRHIGGKRGGVAELTLAP